MFDELQERAVDNSAWDGAAAMSYATNSDDPAAAYAAICAGRRDGDPALQSSWALPHHSRPGEGPNADGVRNALSRLPQTDGLTNREAAQSHLDAHLTEIRNAAEREEAVSEVGIAAFPDADLQVRSDPAKRELYARIVPYNEIGETPIGPEMFRPGSFAHVDPGKVILTLGHRGAYGPPVGRGFSLEERSDGPVMGFKVSKTQHGDEVLELAKDGVTQGVSVVYHLPTSQGEFQYRDGRRVTAWNKVDLREVATTWQPVYERAAVLQVRSKEGEAPVADQEKAAVEAAPEKEKDSEATQVRSFDDALAAFGEKITSALERNTVNFTEMRDEIKEQARSQFVVPGHQPQAKNEISGGHWMQYALRALSGDRISTSDSQYRDLADVVTSDNLGVVPDTFMQNELIGVIDPSRPFLSSTRRLPTPTSGMTLHVPKLVTRPIVGLQSEEKSEIASGATSITTADFGAVTKAGGGDLSLQVLKRSDPSFLDLYLRLLAEAYAMDAEAEALEALLGEDVVDGGSLDPASAALGDAFVSAFDVIRRGPDTIWLSSAAVGAFIDAVSPITGSPVYSSITADFSVPGGISGTVKGLRPVHVPEMTGTGADVIIGPSSGFAWAEDGTFTLQVDVPAKAGRDVAIVGILWFAPYYPGAFTVYQLAS